MYKPYLFCLYVWTNEYILYKYAAGYHSAKVLTRTLVLVASTDVWEYGTVQYKRGFERLQKFSRARGWSRIKGFGLWFFGLAVLCACLSFCSCFILQRFPLWFLFTWCDSKSLHGNQR